MDKGVVIKDEGFQEKEFSSLASTRFREKELSSLMAEFYQHHFI